jgi:hypothetical protein
MDHALHYEFTCRGVRDGSRPWICLGVPSRKRPARTAHGQVPPALRLSVRRNHNARRCYIPRAKLPTYFDAP